MDNLIRLLREARVEAEELQKRVNIQEWEGGFSFYVGVLVDCIVSAIRTAEAIQKIIEQRQYEGW